jgi:hypothetical protein
MDVQHIRGLAIASLVSKEASPACMITHRKVLLVKVPEALHKDLVVPWHA